MKKFLFLMAVAFTMFSGNAAQKLDAYSRSILSEVKSIEPVMSSRLKAITTVDSNNKPETIQAFITVNEDADVEKLTAMGVKVSVYRNNIACVSVPVRVLDDVIESDAVKAFTFARQLKLKNDITRDFTNVTSVHNGTGLSQSYTGKGVIYSCVDTGIDFNHYAFKDSKGNSRMIYAYLPDVVRPKTGAETYSGVHVDSNGNLVETGEFPGYVYPASAVPNLTTDATSESHGSHTLGIGAGGKAGSTKYYGMAPDADIIATGCNLSDASIINGVALAMQESWKRDQPCVVSLSLGSNIGSHDGSDAMSQILDAFVNEGNIICISAGNEGDLNMYAFKPASASQGVVALCQRSSNGTVNYKSVPAGIVDIWGRNKKDFTVYVCVYDKSTGKLNSIGSYKPSANPQVAVKNSTYYSGQVNIIGEKDPVSEKYNIYAYIPSTVTMTNTNYILSLAVVGDDDVDFWATGTGSASLELATPAAGFLTASADGSFNAMGCGKNTLTVGACVSRQQYPCIDGNTYSYSYGTIKDIVPFSSYGVDPNGVSHPDVVAPGFFLISSINSYCSDYSSSGDYYEDLTSNTKMGGREQRYGLMYGTSMSCPCFAGIVALWLQADPHLTVDKIRDVLKNTCINDTYTARTPVKWGYGKVDAYAGIKYVIDNVSVEGAFIDKTTTPLVAFPNPSNGVFEVTVPNAAADATVEVYSISGAQVASVKTNGSKTTTINVADQVTNGAYVVRVVADGTVYTTKMIVKK